MSKLTDIFTRTEHLTNEAVTSLMVAETASPDVSSNCLSLLPVIHCTSRELSASEKLLRQLAPAPTEGQAVGRARPNATVAQGCV